MPVALGVGVPFKSKFSGTVVDPGLALLQSAVLWLDASNPGADSQKVANRGTGGTALDARYGSTTGVDTNDPLLLTHTGTNYLYLPGATGNHVTVPHSTALNVSGSIDIRVRVALTDWTPATGHTLVSKRNNGGTDFTYEFRVNTAGTLLFAWGSDAVTYNEETSSSAPTVSDGQAIWLRVTRDSSTGDVIFYQAADSSAMPSSWTQVGTTQASTPSGIYGSANNLNIGAFYHTSPNFGLCDGKFYRVVIYSGISGTIVFDADFTANTNQSSFTESSSNAATVTINRATSGRKSVMVVCPTLLFGTDDYLEIADNALLDFTLADSFTIMIVARLWGTGGGNLAGLVTKGSNPFWLFGLGTSPALLGELFDGAANPARSNGSFTSGTAALMSFIRNATSDKLLTQVGSTVDATGTTDTTTLTIENTASTLIGRRAGGNYADAEIMHVAVFRSALTSTQLGQIATYLGV